MATAATCSSSWPRSVTGPCISSPEHRGGLRGDAAPVPGRPRHLRGGVSGRPSRRGDRPRPGCGQTNISVSARGRPARHPLLRRSSGQAKYVTATSGVLIDFVVDVRVGSPTFGQWDSVRLDSIDRRAVYVAEGLGHALACVEDGAADLPLLATFNPAGEHGINPLDPEIGLALPEGFVPVVSDKDAAAPSWREAQAGGMLPSYARCSAWRHALAQRGLTRGSGTIWARAPVSRGQAPRGGPRPAPGRARPRRRHPPPPPGTRRGRPGPRWVRAPCRRWPGRPPASSPR